MPGPPPKPASQRRRRNAVAGIRTLPADGPDKAAPAAPRGLGATGRAWWKVIWASPMAAVYLPADLPALTRLAQLIEAIADGASAPPLLAEARHLEDRFGLTPMARRRLQWEIEQAGQADVVPLRPADEERFNRAAGA